MGILNRHRKDDYDVASCLANLDRLEAVTGSGMMDASERARLDALVAKAAARLAVPMAFVTILDAERQVLAGAHGITGDLARTRETSVEASYCQYVVATNDVLVISNSLEDELVADHPATVDGDVRAYLGVPVRFRDQCIGSFCVVDTNPRMWTDEDLAALAELSALAI